MGKNTKKLIVGLLLTLTTPQAWPAIELQGQAYQSLVRASENSPSGSLESAYNLQSKNFENTAARSSDSGVIASQVFEGAAAGWNRGMKPVNWWGEHVVDPVARPVEKIDPATGKTKYSLAARAAANTGKFVASWPLLGVMLVGFWAAAVMAVGGAAAGLCRGIKKALSKG